MPHLPMVKSRQVIAALQEAGFVVVGQEGSHVKLTNGARTVIVKDAKGRDVKRGTLRSILDQAGMSDAEFLARLKG
jgi:predicted RNA binding protein YcfA (HicA-like mRNA interferase family)